MGGNGAMKRSRQREDIWADALAVLAADVGILRVAGAPAD
jgi:hypothetical protein